MSWDPHILKFVKIRLDFVEKKGVLSRYKVINEERNDAVLGTLELTDEEYDFIQSRKISVLTDEEPFRRWIQERLIHASQFRVNGRRLSTFPVREQIMHLNAHWEAGKEIAGPFTD